MSRDTTKERWEKARYNTFWSVRKEDLDLDAIYLIELQELGQIHHEFKDEKLNLMHIAICRLLEPYGFMNSTFLMRALATL
jgi:hypothetical protein